MHNINLLIRLLIFLIYQLNNLLIHLIDESTILINLFIFLSLYIQIHF